jgi:acetyltransferase-like isoleucine patch superfamily enzyme
MVFKNLILSFRNRYHLSNQYSVGKKAIYSCRGNLLSTRITLPNGNLINISAGARLRNAEITIRGIRNKLVIDSDTFFSRKIEMFGDDNAITIGSKSRINGASLYAHNGKSITIGSRCLFSTAIDIRTTDSHKIFSKDGARINPDKDVVIEDRVWIGRMVSVLKGSHIQEGSVIGSMSLVVGKLPPRSICAGVPARTIREDIEWGP